MAWINVMAFVIRLLDLIKFISYFLIRCVDFKMILKVTGNASKLTIIESCGFHLG